MTAASQSTVATTATASGQAVVWRFDPWRERPITAGIGAAAALGMCAVIVRARLPFLLAVALCIASIASMAPALTPVECRLDALGAARRGVLSWDRRPWSAIRRIDRVRAGILLSPFGRRHWLDATRAMLLPMPRARRDELRAVAAALRERHGA